MLLSWTSPSIPQLQSEDAKVLITNSEGAWLASAHGIGCILGSFVGASLVDRLGRKFCILIGSPLYFTCWMAIFFAENFATLASSRVLAGFTDGFVFLAVPFYICEIADPNIRGLLAANISLMTVFGYMLINILGSYFDIATTAIISSTIPVIHFAIFYWMPESPHFFIMRDRKEDAKRSFLAFKGLKDVDDRFEKLVEVVKDEVANKGKFWQLFTINSNRKALFIVLMLRSIQQLCGIGAITVYAQTIFKESSEEISPHLSSIVYFSVQTSLVVISSLLVDKLGRKPLLLLSIIGSGIALTTQAVYFHMKNYTDYDLSSVGFIPLGALLLYVVFFNAGLWSIPMLLLGELFPSNVKAFALALAEVHFGLITIVISKSFQLLTDCIGMQVPFFVFASCCLLGVVFIVYAVPETKGKSLEEIQQWLKGNVSKKDYANGAIS